MSEGKRIAWARLALTIALGIWGIAIYRATAAAGIGESAQSVTHLIILPIHETGHIVFAPFGEFMTALGGSLFQILFPAIFVGYFLYKKDRHAATVPLWFVGVSAIDVVPYIKDAPYGELELIGGEHDWAYILSELTQTHNAARWGNSVLAFGACCLIAAFLLGILWLPRGAESQ